MTDPIQQFSSMSQVIEKYGNKEAWSKMYEVGVTPWNMKQPSLGLVYIKDLLPKKGRFLVPGCGEGYDVVFLASGSDERNVVGVDLSELVVQRARERVAIENPDVAVTFLQADFFDAKANKDILADESFDFLFDYTFLCALHPEYRSSWKDTLARLLKKGAMLVTLMFPLDLEKRDALDGPPFPLSITLYHELLDASFELIELRDCRSPPKREGREKIGIWRRK